MTKIGIRSVLVIVLIFSVTSRFSQGTTLNEAFESALKKNELMEIGERQLSQSRADFSEVKAGLLPTLNLLGTYTRQDQPDDLVNAFTRPDQSVVRLNLSQPLFRGFREFAQWRASERIVERQTYLKDQTKVDLFANVVRAFFMVLQQEKDLANIKELLKLTEQRATDIANRVKIGRSRKSESLQASAQIASLLAQIEAATQSVLEARENFALVTGLERTVELKLPDSKLKVTLAPLENYLQAIEKRPDILAGQKSESASLEGIDIAWGGHLPSIDLGGNYYFSRTGILENVHWDIALTLTIPIFQGGAVSAQVEQATEIWKASSLQLSQTRRNAQNQIRSAYLAIQQSVNQYNALQKAVEASETNYKEQLKEYRLGLVTNLEVLQALDTFQETSRQLDRVFFQAKQNEFLLEAATGKTL